MWRQAHLSSPRPQPPSSSLHAGGQAGRPPCLLTEQQQLVFAAELPLVPAELPLDLVVDPSSLLGLRAEAAAPRKAQRHRSRIAPLLHGTDAHRPSVSTHGGVERATVPGSALGLATVNTEIYTTCVKGSCFSYLVPPQKRGNEVRVTSAGKPRRFRLRGRWDEYDGLSLEKLPNTKANGLQSRTQMLGKHASGLGDALGSGCFPPPPVAPGEGGRLGPCDGRGGPSSDGKPFEFITRRELISGVNPVWM